jgi:ABC-2 type transport system permease protein
MKHRIFFLVIKEFLALLKDKKSRVVVVVPPLLQLLVFGYAATYDLRNVPYAVYNEDRGAASRQLVASFRSSLILQEVARLNHQTQIAPLIDRQAVQLVLHIGPHFSRDLLLGRPTSVQVIVDGRNSNTATLLMNDVQTIVRRFNTWWNTRYEQAGAAAHLVVRAWFNPNLESRWFMVPGIVGLLTLVVTMLVTALSVAREREQGTFDQLLVTPLRPIELLIGKALPGLFIGLLEASVIILIAVVWFEVPLRGSLLTLYTGLLLFIISAIGIGLMISSLSATMQQGLLGAFLFLVPAIILSGFTTPIANMPPQVQALTRVNPMRYFLVILRAVFLEGTPFYLLINQLWPMLVIATVSLTLAGCLFRRRLY